MKKLLLAILLLLLPTLSHAQEQTPPDPVPVEAEQVEQTEFLYSAWIDPEHPLPPAPGTLMADVSEPRPNPDGKPILVAEARPGAKPGIILAGFRLDAEGDKAIPVRVQVALRPGLWRVDAALTTPGEAEPKRWRMESIWQKTTGLAVKTVPLKPGQTLALRLTETVAAAERARLSCRPLTAQVSAKTYGGASVANALKQIGTALQGLPALVASQKRDAAAKKVHRALLAAAQAQAMYENERGSSLFEQEPSLAALVESLSEVSLALHNLVPIQSLITVAGGTVKVRVGVVNAGKSSIALVALGLTADRTTGEVPSVAQQVFRGLKPGKTISASFQVPDPEEARGTVQFNIGMGTAVVTARPTL